jgi:nucleoside permease NupC
VLQNLLENIVNNVPKDKSIVDVTAHPFELVIEKSAAGAREAFNDLCNREKDVGLKNKHRSFINSLVLFVVVK